MDMPRRHYRAPSNGDSRWFARRRRTGAGYADTDGCAACVTSISPKYSNSGSTSGVNCDVGAARARRRLIGTRPRGLAAINAVRDQQGTAIMGRLGGRRSLTGAPTSPGSRTVGLVGEGRGWGPWWSSAEALVARGVWGHAPESLGRPHPPLSSIIGRLDRWRQAYVQAGQAPHMSNNRACDKATDRRSPFHAAPLPRPLSTACVAP